jgi:hypothetical protein
VDEFSSLLLHRLQWYERPGRGDAGFLLELSFGGLEKFFTGFHLALGNGPRAFVLACEEGAAGMGKKNLQLAIPNAVHQKSGADSGHGSKRMAVSGATFLHRIGSGEGEYDRIAR